MKHIFCRSRRARSQVGNWSHATTGPAEVRAEILECRILPATLPLLSSYPEAKMQLYLDFDGHTEPAYYGYGPVSVSAFDLDHSPATLSDAEVEQIRNIYRTVAEDYAPFQVNVTTVIPDGPFSGPVARVAIGNDVVGSDEISGSYSTSFTASGPNVSWVETGGGGSFRGSTDAIITGGLVSHESGHGYGLNHTTETDRDGNVTDSYGSNDYETGSIMGAVAYARERAIWWNKPTNRSSRYLPDHLADADHLDMYMKRLGGNDQQFGYRKDDHGNIAGGATPLKQIAGVWQGSGLIENVIDVDVFSFSTEGGTCSFTVSPPEDIGNLDAVLELRNADGTRILATANPNDRWDASLHISLQPGTYTLFVCSNGQHGDIGTYDLESRFVGLDGKSNVSPGSSPSDLVVQAADSGELLLNWRDNSSTETGFEIEVARHNQVAQRFALPRNSESWRQVGMQAGTYFFRVAALHDGQPVNWSKWVSGVLPKSQTLEIEAEQLVAVRQNRPFALQHAQLPSGETVLQTDAVFLKDWVDLQFAVPAGGTYRLSASFTTNIDGGYFQARINDESIGSLINTGVTEAKSIRTTYLGIVNVNAGTNILRIHFRSADINIGFKFGLDRITLVPVVEPPNGNEPTDVQGDAAEASNVVVRWADNSDDETGFRIELKGAQTYSFTAGPNEQRHVFSNIPQGHYEVVVTACGTASGDQRNRYFETSVTVSPLASPGQLSATVVSDGSVDLQWSYMGSDHTGFKIIRYLAGNTTGQGDPIIVDANARSLRVSGLVSEHFGSAPYVFTVAAFNPRVESVCSSISVEVGSPHVSATLAINTPSVSEAGGIAVLTATLSRISTWPVTLTLGFSGSAKPGSDFAFGAVPAIQIPPGQLSGTLIVTALKDSIRESDEWLAVDILHVDNGIENGEQQAKLQIDEPDIGDSIATALIFASWKPGSVFESALTLLGDGDFLSRDVDIYGFTAEAGEMVTIETKGSSDTESLDTCLRLFNASGTEISSNDDGGIGGYSKIDRFLIPATGTFYIGVSGFPNRTYSPETPGSGIPGATGSYRIGIKVLPVLNIRGTMSNDAIEFYENNSVIAVSINGRSIFFDSSEYSGVSLFGLDGQDTVTVRSVRDDRQVLISGGNGDDTLIVAPRVRKAARIRGNAGNDTLIGGGGDDILEGGIGNDIYFFREASSDGEFDRLIEGVDGGYDTLNFAKLNSPININLGIGAKTQNVHASRAIQLSSALGIEKAIGGSNDDLLTGNSLANSLLGNAGNDTLDGGSGSDSITGGPGNDIYVFGKATIGGEVDSITENAGQGTDTLDFSSRTINVTINISDSTSLQNVHTDRSVKLSSRLGIEIVFGGSGNDRLTGNSIANILVGNSGNDTLIGNTGRDILIGGEGLDRVFGGDDEDVVIAGRTLSDGNSRSMSALLDEWQDAASYATRVSALREGVGSPKVQLTRRISVVNDAGENDSLSGGGGRDWFFNAADDVVTDLFFGELRDVL